MEALRAKAGIPNAWMPNDPGRAAVSPPRRGRDLAPDWRTADSSALRENPQSKLGNPKSRRVGLATDGTDPTDPKSRVPIREIPVIRGKKIRALMPTAPADGNLPQEEAERAERGGCPKNSKHPRNQARQFLYASNPLGKYLSPLFVPSAKSPSSVAKKSGP